MEYGDRIVRKDGGWKKGRFATVIVGPDSEGEIVARFGRMGKYFYAYAKHCVVIGGSERNG